MSDDDELARQLGDLYRPASVSATGAAAARHQGRRYRSRRHRHAAVAALSTSVLVVGAVVVGINAFGGHGGSSEVLVGSPGTTTPRSSSTTAATTPATAEPTTTLPTSTTTPAVVAPSGTGAPAQFVAEVSATETINVLDTRTGAEIRPLSVVPHDIFGTVSADGQTFYESGPAGSEPNCPTGVCAINLSSGTASTIAVSGGADTSIAPDGTESATAVGGSNSVTFASVGASSKTATIPDDEEVAAAGPAYSTWSPDAATFAVVADSDGANGEPQDFEIVVFNATTGTEEQVLVPPTQGCVLETPALSETELWAGMRCDSSSSDELLRYDLASGAVDNSLALPPSQNSISDLSLDSSGQYLLACMTGGTSEQTVWTEHSGTWTRVPNVQAVAAAW